MLMPWRTSSLRSTCEPMIRILEDIEESRVPKWKSYLFKGLIVVALLFVAALWDWYLTVLITLK